MINPNIFLVLAVLLVSIFIIFYLLDDYSKRKAMLELMEDTNHILRNIMLELKKEK